jgi:ABC-type lipoprotein export system ATPase subunit
MVIVHSTNGASAHSNLLDAGRLKLAQQGTASIELSGGEQHGFLHVAIAFALANDPSLLLAMSRPAQSTSRLPAWIYDMFSEN